MFPQSPQSTQAGNSNGIPSSVNIICIERVPYKACIKVVLNCSAQRVQNVLAHL